MRIDSSAPTRIDLAGGTMDIWPLYLFHDGAQTLNAALTLRARCSIVGRDDRRLVVRSADTGAHAEAEGWRELSASGDLRLLGRIVKFYQAEGLELTTRSESPVGAGIAGSSALNIAVSAALARWSGRDPDPEWLLDVAQNLEAQAITVPTGAQDYRPALYGGVSAVELRVDGVVRVALPVDPEELTRHLVVAYTQASRDSGINNWDVTKRHIDGDARVFDHFERIRDIAAAMRQALVAHDWREVARQIEAEWEARKGLAPGVTTPAIDALLSKARTAGAWAGKVCGAGGGGCLFCLVPPDRTGHVRLALTAGGARLLDCAIDPTGLQIETTA